MNRLNREKQVQVLKSLIEGNSIRATVRLTGAAKDTVIKLLESVGAACADYQDKVLRNLTCKRVQCDEIWSFCYAKDKNVPAEKQGKFGFGSVWTWVAIDADTKLVPCWRIGDRNAWHAQHFMYDLASRLTHRIQLTTDGHRVYLQAVEQAFGEDIDYAMLVKLYGSDRGEGEVRYSPPDFVSCRAMPIVGKPDSKHISTSFAERQNLSMRMHMRRFTRLTNAFSKKVDNLAYNLALYFMYYNFCRVHQTLRVTPAMEARVTDHVWEIEEILRMMDGKLKTENVA